MRKFVRLVVLVIGLAILAGCAVTSPLPSGYVGPTARIMDFATMETKYRAAYFYVVEVDGRRIENNLDAFRAANRGKGMAIFAAAHNRRVPAGAVRLKLEARTVYGAPVQELVMAATMRNASRLIEVELIPDEDYEVRGILEEGSEDVWLVRSKGAERVGRPVNAR